MHGLSGIDPGRTIDWGNTSEDYAKYRPGPGVLAREFTKRGAKRVCGTDISEVQIKMAEELATKKKEYNKSDDSTSLNKNEMSFVFRPNLLLNLKKDFLGFETAKL